MLQAHYLSKKFIALISPIIMEEKWDHKTSKSSYILVIETKDIVMEIRRFQTSFKTKRGIFSKVSISFQDLQVEWKTSQNRI